MSCDCGSCYGARLNGDAVEQSHDLTPLLRGCLTTFPFNLAHTVCIGKANLSTVTTHMHTSQSSPSPSPTIVCLDGLFPSLLEAEDEVNPEVQVVTDVLALQGLATLGGEVMGIYTNRW